jgi:hypothetical protein
MPRRRSPAARWTHRQRRRRLDMEFEWDEAKNAANLAKHGIDFEDAAAILLGDAWVEPAAYRGEERSRQRPHRRPALNGDPHDPAGQHSDHSGAEGAHK